MEEKLVIFKVGNSKIGIPVCDVDYIVLSCEITPLPGAPQVVRGVVDVHGCLIPVFNIEHRFGLPDTGLKLDEFFIICNTRSRKVILHVRNLIGMETYSLDSIVLPNDIVPGLEQLDGLVRIADDIVLLQNLSRFLSLDEEKNLNEAMEKLKQP